jgi:hypothetical protein
MGQQPMAAVALRKTLLQPDQASARQTWRHLADQLRPLWPKLSPLQTNETPQIPPKAGGRTAPGGSRHIVPPRQGLTPGPTAPNFIQAAHHHPWWQPNRFLGP